MNAKQKFKEILGLPLTVDPKHPLSFAVAHGIPRGHRHEQPALGCHDGALFVNELMRELDENVHGQGRVCGSDLLWIAYVECAATTGSPRG